MTVKAGGMRIVQHKTPNTERPAKDLEDCTGLTVSLISLNHLMIEMNFF